MNSLTNGSFERKVESEEKQGHEQVVSGDQVERVAKWLRLFVDENQVVELRALNVAVDWANERQPIAGFFDGRHLEEMAREALRLSGHASGVYFTLNPIHPTALHRRPNGVAVGGSNISARSSEIISRKWLLVDVDRGSNGKEAATDEEKEHVYEAIRTVRDGLRADKWPDPILADSGNGYHLLYRIDLPTADNELVKRVLLALAKRYDTADAKVDVKVYDPVRITKLYGTVAKKGEESPERPYRQSSLLEIPAQIQVVSKELLEKLAKETPQRTFTPAVSQMLSPVAPLDRQAVLSRARAYLKAVPGAISGEGGHPHTFAAACKLVLGFDLSIEEALPILREWSEAVCQPPWSEKELIHKLEDANEQPGVRGYLLLEGPSDEADDDPDRLANVILCRHFSDERGILLRYWQGEWYQWDGARFNRLSAEDTRLCIRPAIKKEFERLHAQGRKEKADSGEEEKRPAKIRKVTNNLVDNVLQALASLVRIDAREQPAWIGDEHFGPAKEVIAAANGLVPLHSLTEGKPCLMPATPTFFTLNALDYEVKLDASPPEKWLAFLNQLWPDDHKSIETLQEWMGYCLAPDTTQQKILFLYGRPRSGKGTIARVLTGLVGKESVAGPTLSSFSSHFGLMPLLNKPLAIIADARLSGKSDQAAIVERLLSISGEDTLTVDRKNREMVSCKLPTRIMLISNELPRLTDASCALASRLLLLKLPRSFEGEEDPMLSAKLLKELPGILLWAGKGLQRLQNRGYFLQPKTGQDSLEAIVELSSPTTAFVEERCEIDSEQAVLKATLFQEWKKWCLEQGQNEGNQATFGRNLHAAYPEIEDYRSSYGSRQRAYLGINIAGEAPWQDPFRPRAGAGRPVQAAVQAMSRQPSRQDFQQTA